MHQGSCLCGAVRYRINGDLGPIVFCHCRQCRKAQGSAFASNSPIRAADFELLSGADALRSYRATPLKERVFCGHCGSPLYSRRDDLPAVLRLRLGTLDTAIAERPSHHIYAASKAEWFEILDDLPRHAELETAG